MIPGHRDLPRHADELVAVRVDIDHRGGRLDVDQLQEQHFPVRLTNGRTVGLESQGKAKHTAAKRWGTAVNNWGQLGSRAFHACYNPQLLDKELGYLNRAV